MRTRPVLALVLAGAWVLGGCMDENSELGDDRQAVINGEPAPPGSYPAVGAILLQHHYKCTATLIAPDVAITAGHCLRKSTFGGKLYFSLDPDIADIEADTGVELFMTHMHPGFPGTGGDDGLGAVHDIGVLILAEPIYDVTPETLYSDADTYKPAVGTDLQLVAYGLDAWWDTRPGVKRAAPNTIEEVGELELRMHAGELQACEGDSGGPLFTETKAGRRLVAVVSRAGGDSRKCDKGSIVTRVDPYGDWVAEASADRELPVEGCSASQSPGSAWLAALIGLLLLRRRRD